MFHANNFNVVYIRIFRGEWNNFLFLFFCWSFYFWMHPCHALIFFPPLFSGCIIWLLLCAHDLARLLARSLACSFSILLAVWLACIFSVDGNTWAQVIALYPTLVECITCSSPEISSALKEALGPFKDFMQPPVAKVQNGESWSITSHKLFIQPEPWHTTHKDLFLPQHTFYWLFSWKPSSTVLSFF